MPAVARKQDSAAREAASPQLASCATGRVAGHPGIVSDPIRALLCRGTRSGYLLDPG